MVPEGNNPDEACWTREGGAQRPPKWRAIHGRRRRNPLTRAVSAFLYLFIPESVREMRESLGKNSKKQQCVKKSRLVVSRTDLKPKLLNSRYQFCSEATCTNVFPGSAWECRSGRPEFRQILGRDQVTHDTERRRRHSHAEHGNEIKSFYVFGLVLAQRYRA